MLSFYLIWSLLYFLFLWKLSMAWPVKVPDSNSSTFFSPSVSLLIPFRNEVHRCTVLAGQLKKLTYPKLDILLVDDQSEDGSFDFFSEIFEKDERVRVAQSPGTGKKAALEFGVGKARSEIILTSDADCEFPSRWIEEVIAPFENPSVQLVAGPVMTLEKRGFFGTFQQLDWASILLLSNFSFQKQRPLMCSAANLAYRKSAFLKINGYEGNRTYVSGDDEFLLKKIRNTYGIGSCVYLPFVQNLVLTEAQPDWRSFLQQRIRWAGKWKAHDSGVHVFSALFSFVVQVIWLASVLLFSCRMSGVLIFGSIWMLKIVAEKLALGRVLTSFNMKRSLFDFIKTSFVHPFYVLSVGIMSLSGNFSWKGRSN